MPFDAADLAAFVDPDMPGYAVAVFGFGDVAGNFNDAYGESLGFSGGTVPVLTVASTSVASVNQGTPVTIGAVSYVVARVEPARTGMTRLILEAI